jgi:hypothetical protein
VQKRRKAPSSARSASEASDSCTHENLVQLKTFFHTPACRTSRPNSFFFRPGHDHCFDIKVMQHTVCSLV